MEIKAEINTEELDVALEKSEKLIKNLEKANELIEKLEKAKTGENGERKYIDVSDIKKELKRQFVFLSEMDKSKLTIAELQSLAEQMVFIGTSIFKTLR